jgi:hypothetical protein
MKRDMELIRKILIYFEDKDDDHMVENLEIEEYDSITVQHHLVMLFEAGFIAAEPERTSTGRVFKVHPFRLTWEGHEFLAAARNDSIWAKTKINILSRVSDIPFSLLKELLITTIRSELS